jgi:hypothetical protein
MTIRVSKSSFDIRAKLSELKRKFGAKGSEIAAAETLYEARTALNSGRKNMIINGAMTINQRHGTNSYAVPNATGGSYALDRWAINEACGGAISVNMDGDPGGGNADKSPVQEFTRAMQVACSNGDSSVTGNENAHFFQNIEGYNIAHLRWGSRYASPVTLSFWVRSNIPGIYCVGLENGATDRTCIKEYKIEPGFRWQKVELTFPGCTDGTWITNNGCGMRVRFCLASGNSYTQGVNGSWVNSDELATPNQINWMVDSNSRYFITGVQLEKGRTATEFDHRFHTEELALCMRYYQNSYDHAENKFPANSTAPDNAVITTSWLDGNCPFPMFRVPMRIAPGVTLRGRESSTVGQVRNNGTLRTAVAENITNQGVSYINVSSGTAGAYNAFTFECDAEL